MCILCKYQLSKLTVRSDRIYHFVLSTPHKSHQPVLVIPQETLIPGCVDPSRIEALWLLCPIAVGAVNPKSSLPT